MKMKQKMFLGFAVLILAAIFILAGCDTDNEDNTNPNTDPKTIKITGFNGVEDGHTIWLNVQTSLGPDNVNVAFGSATVSGETLIFNLKNNVELTSDWVGYGSYYIIISNYVETQTSSYEWRWVFTNGVTVTSIADVPKYSIDKSTATIPFDKFFLFSQPEQEYQGGH